MLVEWDSSSTLSYTHWNSTFKNILNQCFSIRTIKTVGNNLTTKSTLRIRRILSNFAKKGKAQRSIVKNYFERLVEIEIRQHSLQKADRLCYAMNTLTENEKFSPTGYWKLKKAAERKLKGDTLYTVLKDNGVEVSGATAIKEAYREEFQHRLRTRAPHEDLVGYVEETNSIIREWLQRGDSIKCLFFNGRIG